MTDSKKGGLNCQTIAIYSIVCSTLHTFFLFHCVMSSGATIEYNEVIHDLAQDISLI